MRTIGLFLLFFAATACAALGEDDKPATFHGVSLGMTVEQIREKLGPEYAPHYAVNFYPNGIGFQKGDCRVRIGLDGNNEDVRKFVSHWGSDHYPPAILHQPATALALPICFFNANGVRVEDFVKQLVNAYPFYKGTLFTNSDIHLECIQEDSCWLGLLPSGELVHVGGTKGTLFVLKATDAEKNAFAPPKIKF